MGSELREALMYDEAVNTMFRQISGCDEVVVLEIAQEVFDAIYSEFELKLLEHCSINDINTFLKINSVYSKLLYSIVQGTVEHMIEKLNPQEGGEPIE